MAETHTQLPDAADLEVRENEADMKKNEETVVSLWKKRFNQSRDFRRPYLERNLRMYKLYRAYRDARNYAYNTNLMPPTGFEIIETVKPRLASAKIKVDIYPTKKEDAAKKDNIDKWDELVEYNLQEMEFDDKKIQWINAQLLFGNGVGQIFWEGNHAGLEVVDNWLFYPDPKAQNRLKNSRWEIKQIFKTKAEIEKEEKARGENPLYTWNGKSLIETEKWDEIEDETSTEEGNTDLRRERYQINTLKMGQIDSGKQKKSDIQESRGSLASDKDKDERNVEIWECWDHIEDKLQVVMNRKHLVRDEENPYLKVNGGQVFIDMPDIMLNWEYYAMGHLEPVETTIHEIADSRNQAMDDIVFSLDPIRKVKKGKGYKPEDIRHSPGAFWELERADDVVIERGPEISRAWVEKDNLLRREIQTSLALSEYVTGLPQSGQEPASKVEMLLMQTNIRFSLIVRQMEIALTELANSIIEMNQEFLEEDLSYRILGKDFRWGEFTAQDKEVKVDAWVSIEPVREKTPAQEANEALEMYKLFVVDDKPEPNDQGAVEQWKKKKALLQKIIARKFGYEEYEDILAPEIESKPEGGNAQGVAPEMEGGLAAESPVPRLIAEPEPVEIIPPETTQVPGATTPATEPSPGILDRLFRRRN